MITTVLFDLDGVLVDAKMIHFESLNKALGPDYSISMNEHLSTYDGLKTMEKLSMLSERKGLPEEFHDNVWRLKQKYTAEALQKVNVNGDILALFKYLSENDIKIGVCSNSIRKTVNLVLSRLQLIEFVDVILSNNDVISSKPHPEIYWKAMAALRSNPSDTLIVEDSPHGLAAANMTNARVFRVDSPADVSIENIAKEIEASKPSKDSTDKWVNKKINVVIPMAGRGSRFANAGYTFPKPLIDVRNKPMIQVVVDNLALDANYIFIVQKSHRDTYNLDTMLRLIAPDCTIIEVDGVTEGAACTALLAKAHIDNDNPLFFANSDQYVKWDSKEFFYKMSETNVDGGIPVFKSTHPKWSFAKTDDNGFLQEVQ